MKPRHFSNSPIFYGLLIGIVGSVMVMLWYRASDPAAAFSAPQHNLQTAPTQPVMQKGRRIQHVTLVGSSLGEIDIVVSLPDPLPPKKLPIVFVLGGLGSGESNISYVTNAGDNAIVGYDWPIPVHFPTGFAFIRDLPELYRQVRSIPEQIASAINWLADQPWADDKRISLLGFSLGALATPAVENLAMNDGHPIDWTILAYGGAPLGYLFSENPHMKPEWLRKLMGPIIDIVLRPLEPTANLPHLSSHFLILEGRDDGLIPADARNRLNAAVPEPKDVVVFNGDHMGVGPGKEELLAQIIKVSRDWLAQNGAINP